MAVEGSTEFKGVPDRYKGITVNSEDEKCDDIDEFVKKLAGMSKNCD